MEGQDGSCVVIYGAAMSFDWKLNQSNLITFVIVDAANTEVIGLGGTFSLSLSKAGGAFAASGGTKAEIGSGWYSYLATAGEADTPGPVSIAVTGAGAVQQNLEYVVRERNVNAVEYTYIVTNSVTTLPIAGVEVWFTTDAAGNNIVWVGTTDAAGVARDAQGGLPFLDPGPYYVWKQRAGYTDDQNPDLEVVA